MKNKNAEFLLDTFVRSGTDIGEFEEAINEMTESAKFVRCKTDELSVLSLLDDEDVIKKIRALTQSNAEEADRIRFYKFSPNNLPCESPEKSLIEYNAAVSKKKLLSFGENAEVLIDEMKSGHRMMLYDGRTVPYFVSDNFFSSLDRIGINGQFIKKPSVERDMSIAKCFEGKQNVTLVTKVIEGGAKKVFCILSERYGELSQNKVLEVFNRMSVADMGNISCREWQMNHCFTSVYAEFPEFKDNPNFAKRKKDFAEIYKVNGPDFVPGVFIYTSDTGDASFTVQGTWRIGGSVVFGPKVSRKHTKGIDSSAILKAVEERVFSEYIRLPEVLCNLMMTDVTDPYVDLTTAKGQVSNADSIGTAIKSIAKQIDLVKAVGKKVEKVLVPQMIEEFDASMPVTAYDIAMSFLKLPERVSGIADSGIKRLQEAVALAPYADYGKTMDDSVILIA